MQLRNASAAILVAPAEISMSVAPPHSAHVVHEVSGEGDAVGATVGCTNVGAIVGEDDGETVGETEGGQPVSGQPENTVLSLTEIPRVRQTKAVHPLKADDPILVTVEGIVAVVKLVQP